MTLVPLLSNFGRGIKQSTVCAMSDSSVSHSEISAALGLNITAIAWFISAYAKLYSLSVRVSRTQFAMAVRGKVGSRSYSYLMPRQFLDPLVKGTQFLCILGSQSPSQRSGMNLKGSG